MEKLTRFFAVCSFTFSIIFLFTTGLVAQIYWTHVVDEPVLDYGPDGTWDDGCLFFPHVLKDGDTLKMWYGGVDDAVFSGTWGIGYAWSLDGINWHRHATNPLQSISVSPGSVLKEGDMLKIWYSDGIDFRYATSTNGIDWEPHPDPVLQLGTPGDWDSNIPIFYPDCVIKDNGIYKMYYTGSLGSFPFIVAQFGLATSTDGINWTKYDDPSTTDPPYANSDPVLTVGDSTEWDAMHLKGASVRITDKGYEMWYSGLATLAPQQWLGYATSTDGINWTKWPTNPIVDSCPSWGDWGYTPGTVLKYDGNYHMWYASFNSAGDNPRIGYMTAPIELTESNVLSYERRSEIPDKFNLLQNYPNPFNPETTIEYEVPQKSRIKIDVFNLLGQKIKTLVDLIHQPGNFQIKWNGSDEFGKSVPSGIYFYSLISSGSTQIRKMSLLK